jgi:lipopolysaccharide export system protein LptA
MRRLRPLLLLAIAVILALVAGLYYIQKGIEQRQAPAKAKPLPPNTTATAPDWVYTKLNEEGVEVFRLTAKSFQEITNPARLLLDQVEVRVLDKDGLSFDRIKTASAVFDNHAGTLLADGDVEIVTGEPAGQAATGRRKVRIQTSGLTFDTKTQRADTDRHATFLFDQGGGEAVGASYDPNTRELMLRSQARVTWHGRGPRSVPMNIQAGEIVYKEKDSAIVLSSSCQLVRGSLKMAGDSAFVMLKEGVIDRVIAFKAQGSDRPEGGRQLDFAAGTLFIALADGGEVSRIDGEEKTTLSSVDATTRTTVTSNHLEMRFDASSGESQLQTAVATGSAVIDARPLANAVQHETRVLRSEMVELRMRPGGREIDSVRTLAPGVAEFLPSTPTQRRRRMEADRISVLYGAESRIRSLQATKVATRTESPKPANRPAPPVMLTWSRDFTADFDPKSSELTRIEQRGDFRFEQGDRKGSSDSATLDSKKDLITMQGGARTLDPAGSLAADLIATDQGSGDVTAIGKVASTHQSDRAAKPTAVISESQPFHALAARMFAPGTQKVIRYEGNVVLWQGGNRIEAGWAEIDREKHSLAARDNVVCRLVEEPAASAPKKTPVTTLIRAPQLFYTEETRTALFTGGVTMLRAGLQVTSSQLRGVFVVKDGKSQLDTSYADGQVRILQKAPDRTRQGSAEHAEYYVSEAKVVLYGGVAQFEDSLRGTERGDRLTWYQEKDRLVVEGRKGEPANGRILRSPKR